MRPVLLFLMLCAGGIIIAQPGLEYTYTNSMYICHLEKSGEKYFAMDINAKQCRIYNLDHTPYKTINLEVPEGYYLYNIQYVTENTFNQDDLIELVYTCSKYNAIETSYYYSYESRLVNEQGTTILELQGAGYSEIIETESQGRKFLVYVYDFYQIPATTHTMIYSLPEAGQTGMKSQRTQEYYRQGNPWPNPSGGMVHIPFELPENTRDAEMVLYNINGMEVMRAPLDPTQSVLILPLSNLIPGTYTYKLKHDNGESEGKKIMIQ